MDALFIEFIQVVLKQRSCISKKPSDEEWKRIFDESVKQGVVGVAYGALDILAQCGQKPPTPVLYHWISLAEFIKQKNKLLNERTLDILRILKEEGFRSCILKGQGNAILYPDPYLRSSGDIDVWVEASKKDIVGFVKRAFPEVDSSRTSYHIDYPIFNDVAVEVHYIPTFAIDCRYQRKLERYIDIHKIEQFQHFREIKEVKKEICVPTDEFNIIFQLSHMQRHFFCNGFGFKQLLDFYFLLKWSYGKINIEQVRIQIKDLGLYKFAQGITWIMQDVLGLESHYLFVEPEKKRGQLILNEIMATGDMGHYEQRKFRELRRKSFTASVIVRNMKMVKMFPGEALFTPITGLINRYLKSCD